MEHELTAVLEPERMTLQSGDPATWTPAQRTRNERMAQYLRALRAEGTLTAACTATGISQPTVWRWREEFTAFGDAVTQFLTRDRQSLIEENLFRIATSTDPKMANAAVKAGEIYLKALDPDRYADRQKIEQTITINSQVQVIHEAREKHRIAQQEKLRQIRTIDALPGGSTDEP
ncbi:hypothetical protein HNQ07_004701 [Deinococcus metalli]|uniref:Homeodomain phBC6A51-type domain-containing protein n=1 Tax=Deinococcus metalli TaxID=1141878 RepID=A0A7W8KLH0_9DEIO|nr:helix-turn-helix domain-containing protein [Deinococcus metalli]MBB5379186.1 hypothetical protein [Deinococcus metalli]GHF65271.1 hypothetical protein GCM10017781_46260 [Deinococcus metalli]